MKFLFDLLPVIILFTGYFSGITAPALGLDKPIEFATALAMVVAALQMIWMLARRRKIDALQWISFGLIMVMGTATLVLHNAMFIKLKATVLSLVMASALLIGRYGLGKLPLKLLLGKELKLADIVWDKLMWAWVGFFVLQGGVNLYVALNYPEAVWVKFKLVLVIGFPLLFAVAQGLWLAKHMPQTNADSKES
ncbi:septation protein A [Chitinimonas sp.]|uniref:septation protein A n=1 Tax=Chitinimonas sp. TaxID=1934313 RepID=UPI0035B4B920